MFLVARHFAEGACVSIGQEQWVVAEARRAARRPGDDAMNEIQTKLMEKGAKTPDQRRAHFVSALCVAWPDGQTQTFGEMSSEDKHGLPPRGRGLSHRARAFLKLAEACLAKR